MPRLRQAWKEKPKISAGRRRPGGKTRSPRAVTRRQPWRMPASPTCRMAWAVPPGWRVITRPFGPSAARPIRFPLALSAETRWEPEKPAGVMRDVAVLERVESAAEGSAART